MITKNNAKFNSYFYNRKIDWYFSQTKKNLWLGTVFNYKSRIVLQKSRLHRNWFAWNRRS